MIPKTLDLKQRVTQLKETLGNNDLNTAKQYPSKICARCKEREADSLVDILCKICFRKIHFDKLPESGKRAEILAVVPGRFIGAELEHLSEPLKNKLLEETQTGAYLWGQPGVGKTYALGALAKHFITEGYKCRRIIYELLCLKLRDTFKPSSKSSEWEIIEPLVTCDKLFLEDIGTTKSMDSVESDFSLRTLLVLIDLRLENCKPTYITTNKSVENLAASFDQRIGDRLKLFKILELKGKSKR